MTTVEVGNIEHAIQIAKNLKNDPEFYDHCSKISLQIICVLLSKVVRDLLGPERKRSDDDYSV